MLLFKVRREEGKKGREGGRRKGREGRGREEEGERGKGREAEGRGWGKDE